MAAPLAAQQQRAQDFTLPPGPTPTPTVEGPVDDTGPVPVRPRVIPTSTPTPTPVPTTPPEVTPTPAPSPSAESTRPQAAQRQAPAASPNQSAAQPPAPVPSPSPSPSALEELPSFTPEPIAPASPEVPEVGLPSTEASATLPQWWPWAAGLLGALLAGLAGGWWIARRRAPVQAPTIERPVVASPPAHSPDAVAPARIAATLEVEQLTRSFMALTLKYRLTLANRSDRTLRDLAVSADLASARRNLPVEQQIATAETNLPTNAALDRLGPHQSATVSGELRLPISAVELFQQGQVPLCVPMARLRIEGEGMEPHLATYLVGIGSGVAGGRVHPLPLNGPPGSYDGVQVRPLD
ncbi:hypothetical protein [Altererythrobacter sp. BO-6]|uniref:hypothetical protein n=1 Tax=Altererythrobacter sp. BO-6 TaxID=2604537 RepID=UPI0019D18C69|nr:hypothetical protein [Altererythrobacter sp. BO-6]